MDRPTPQASQDRSIPCWSCGEACQNPHVCGSCAVIVPCPPEFDYFSILGLERRYTVDAARLRQGYLELSRRFHPDRFGQKTPRERRIAVEKSTTLNAAYKTLLDPVKRAEYMLRREAGLTDLDKLRAGPELLEEIMETRERILELRAEPSEEARAGLRREKKKAEAEETRILDRLHELFARFDRGECVVLSEVEREVVAHRYNRGILQELSGLS
jgi:molecular chaperone HscB